MSKKRRSYYSSYARRNWIYRHKLLIILVSVFILLAIAAAVFLILYSNRKKQEETVVQYEAMTASSLPTVEFEYSGHDVDPLMGYTDEMDVHYIRRSIFVLQDTYDVPIKVSLYGNDISSVNFKVIDAENDNLIQSGQAADISTADDILNCTLKIDNMIEDNREYILEISLTDADGKNIYYYIRIIRDSQTTLASQLELAIKFNNAIYNINSGDNESFVTGMLTTNYWYNDNTDFSHITLYSSLSGITWGTMKVSVASDINMEILDVDGEIGHFLFSYLVKRTEGNTTEYYRVSEYMRIRLTDTYAYVLDYDRTADEVFDPEEDDVMGTQSAKLGVISDKDFSKMCNREETLSCFVADKTLWAMDTETKTLKKIFTFSTGVEDVRGNFTDHDIRIINVSDEGDIQFIVYGYMNAGLHEGKVGIGMYTYHADSQQVEEEVFIPTDLPYDILKNSVGDLFYLNSANHLYVMMDQYLYKLDLNSDEAELVTDSLVDGAYIIHYDGDMIAWQEGGNVNDASAITVLDMESEESYRISADNGSSIKILGFLNRDAVYGQGKSGETYENADGEQKLLMSDIYVVNKNLEVQTQVAADPGFFVGAVDDYNRVVFKKVIKSDEGYADSDDYTLFANETEAYPEMESYSEYEEVKRTVYYAVFADSTTSAGELAINEKAKVMFTNEKTVDILNVIEDSNRYYVYARGNVSIVNSAAAAIQYAYDQTGLVLRSDGSLFYKRGIIPASVELSSVTTEKAYQKIAAGKMIDVTGISLTQAMYFMGSKIPVVWEWDGTSYILFGYDSSDNITMYNIETNEKLVLTFDYMSEIFPNEGHVYIVDMDDEEE